MHRTRKIYRKKGTVVKTGGVKEFNYTKEDLKRIEQTDTNSTLEFKKSLWIWRYFKSENKSKVRPDMEKHYKFFDVNLVFRNMQKRRIFFFNIELGYREDDAHFKKAFTKFCPWKFSEELPNVEYVMNIKYRKYFLLKREKTIYFDLNNNYKKDIII